MPKLVRHALLLASGGIDSTTCWWLLHDRGWAVEPLFIDFGQPARDYEWRVITLLARVMEVSAKRLSVDADLYPGFPRYGLLPARNLMLLSLAAARAASMGTRVVAVGFNAHDAARSDASPAFLEQVQRPLALTSPAVRLLAPLAPLTKAQVVTCARRLEAPLDATVSCYTSVAGGCGSCRGCFDRRAALAAT